MLSCLHHRQGVRELLHQSFVHMSPARRLRVQRLERMTAIARAYSRLDALAQTLDTMTQERIEERYVEEYHSAVHQLEAGGLKLAEFRVPPSDVEPRGFRQSFTPGMTPRFTQEKSVARGLLLMKARALLTYFTFAAAKPAREVGFRPPS